MSTSVVKVDVLMEGYLHKRSPKQLLTLAIHQRRYFLLTSSLTTTHHQHFHLSYFRSHDHHIPLGHIPISHVQALRPSQEENGRFDVVMSGMAGGEGRVYVLRCENALEYSRWMDQLQRAMDEEGKRRPLPPAVSAPTTFRGEYREAVAAIDERRGERRKSQWDVKDALDLMMMGTPVTLVTPSTATPSSPSAFPTIFTPSILLYKHDDTPLGSLYWFDAHTSSPPQLSASSRLSLHNLTDIFLGKQSRAYTALLPSGVAAAGTAGGVKADCCFSACTKIGVSLHVCGNSREVVSAWVYGINSIMMSKGQRKIRTKDKAAAASDRRASLKGYGGVPGSPSFSSSSTRSTSHSVSDRLHIHPADDFHIADTKRSSLSTPRAAPGVPFIYSTVAAVDNATKSRRVDAAMRDWLDGLGNAFSVYYDGFVENGVDLTFLATLTTADLDELGVSRLHGKKMLQSIKERSVGQDDSAAVESRPSGQKSFVMESASAPTSAVNSIRSAPPPSASALLAAMSTPTGSNPRPPFFPPPPIHPQLARRESLPSTPASSAAMAATVSELKRLSLVDCNERPTKAAGSGRGEGIDGGKSTPSSASEGVKNYFGSVWSGLVSGSSTPKGMQQQSSSSMKKGTA